MSYGRDAHAYRVLMCSRRYSYCLPESASVDYLIIYRGVL